jgi:hypothetical protein
MGCEFVFLLDFALFVSLASLMYFCCLFDLFKHPKQFMEIVYLGLNIKQKAKSEKIGFGSHRLSVLRSSMNLFVPFN